MLCQIPCSPCIHTLSPLRWAERKTKAAVDAVVSGAGTAFISLIWLELHLHPPTPLIMHRSLMVFVTIRCCFCACAGRRDSRQFRGCHRVIGVLRPASANVPACPQRPQHKMRLQLTHACTRTIHALSWHYSQTLLDTSVLNCVCPVESSLGSRVRSHILDLQGVQ